MNRRQFVTSLSGCVFLLKGNFASAIGMSIGSILGRISDDPTLVENSWRYREYDGTKGVGRGNASKRKLSPITLDLIIAFEVVSPEVYDKRYRRPVWPKGQSGITIGIGYDLRFAGKSDIDRDWPDLSQDNRSLLYDVAGLGGTDASKALKAVSAVEIPWDAAHKQFIEFLPYPTRQTEDVFPNCSALSDDSFGALVSLVYNRGPSISRSNPKRKEMYEIRQLMRTGKRESFEKIPDKIRSMNRIWENDSDAKGLLDRKSVV